MKTLEYITLPEHEATTGIRICHECRGVMIPTTQVHTLTIKGAPVEVHNIHAYKCILCGEVVYTAAEAKLIEDTVNLAKELISHE